MQILSKVCFTLILIISFLSPINAASETSLELLPNLELKKDTTQCFKNTFVQMPIIHIAEIMSYLCEPDLAQTCRRFSEILTISSLARIASQNITWKVPNNEICKFISSPWQRYNIKRWDPTIDERLFPGYLSIIVKRYPNICSLDFLDLGFGITNKDLQLLAQLPNLHTLKLTYEEEEHLSGLAGLKSLRELSVPSGYITDEVLPYLANLTELRILRSNGKITSLSALGDTLSRLYTLDLHDSWIEVKALSALSNAKSLRELDVGASDGGQDYITEGVLPYLANLTELRILRLKRTSITTLSGLEGILQKLYILDIRETNVKDETLSALSNAKSLRELYVEGSGMMSNESVITDKFLSYLANLTELRILEVSSTRVTGKGFLALGDTLSRLHSLILSEIIRGMDEILLALKGASSLRELNLRNTDVTDKGLSSLTSLTELRILCLNHTYKKFTSNGLSTLQQALPRLQIIRTPERSEICSIRL